jgi:MFS family permease
MQYYVSLALLGFGMSAMTYIPMSQIVARWFVKRRGLAMGMLLTSSGLGAFVMTPMLGLVFEYTGDWRMLFAVMGATAPLVAILALLFLRNAPTNESEIDAGAVVSNKSTHQARVYQSSTDWPLMEALRAKSLWLIVVAFGMCLLSVNLVNSQAILHLTDMGISQLLASSAIGTMGLCSVGGRLGGGILGDRIEPKFLLALGLLFQAAGFVILLVASHDLLVHGFALVFGIGLGLSIVTAPLMLANYFGSGSLARINATTGIFTIGVTAFAPTVAGYASDTLGSYTLVFLGFSALAALLAIPVALLRPPMRVTSPNVA